MKTYICTCGISVLTKSGMNIERLRNVPLSLWNEYQDDIIAVRDRVSESLQRLRIPAQLDDSSAEIKSLIKMGVKLEDRVILIASDTVDCKLCAELVRSFLEEREICSDARIKLIKGLQAMDGDLFQREGLKNLLVFLVSLEHEDIVLNPTGGFKSVVPYLSLIGMLFNKPVRYIHEDSEDVITLSNVPILLNESLLLLVEEKLRKIEKECSIPKTEWQTGIDFNDRRFDALVEEIYGQITLSGLGFLFWERFKLDYPEELLKDDTDPSQKPNKLMEQKTGHHGLEKIRPIAVSLLNSPYVRGILNSCENQPKSQIWIKPLAPDEARKHLQRVSESICIVTNIKSDAGYSFLVETTARNATENKKIAELLSRKFFS